MTLSVPDPNLRRIITIYTRRYLTVFDPFAPLCIRAIHPDADHASRHPPPLENGQMRRPGTAPSHRTRFPMRLSLESQRTDTRRPQPRRVEYRPGGARGDTAGEEEPHRRLPCSCAIRLAGGLLRRWQGEEEQWVAERAQQSLGLGREST